MAKKKMDIMKKKVTTPVFRLSFPHLDAPHKFENDQEEKFSATMLLPREGKNKADLTKMREAIKNAKIELWGSDESDWPNIEYDRRAFKDGDKKKDLDGYAGMTTVKATSKKRPGIIDQGKNKITPDEVGEVLYAGCWCRATLIAFAYEKGGKPGVGFALQNIMKVRDDAEFSGKPDAEDDFKDFEAEESESEDANDSEDW